MVVESERVLWREDEPQEHYLWCSQPASSDMLCQEPLLVWSAMMQWVMNMPNAREGVWFETRVAQRLVHSSDIRCVRHFFQNQSQYTHCVLPLYYSPDYCTYLRWPRSINVASGWKLSTRDGYYTVVAWASHLTTSTLCLLHSLYFVSFKQCERL